MSDRVPASGTVHWVGAGLSSGGGLRVVRDHAARLVLWARTAGRAEDRLARLDLSGRAEARAFSPAALAADLGRGDVVVSMLPATQHPALLRLCVSTGAHFACSSYVSDEILAESPAARAAGVAVLTEAGLDPGIDHLAAHKLIGDARSAVGDAAASASFTSYCGGVPAVANDFRYRFSWAPRGVLAALGTACRYIEGGVERTVPHPWEATRRHVLAGEPVEVFPNRDSTPFISQYRIPPSWRLETFIRGTLRLDGWCAAWEPVFEVLRSGDRARINALADDLAARYPATAVDHDRVVLAVALTVRTAGTGEWSGSYLLDVVGDDRESAMSRCVSLPLAFGITEILSGRISPGLHRAAEDPDEATRWLDALRQYGIHGEFR